MSTKEWAALGLITFFIGLIIFIAFDNSSGKVTTANIYQQTKIKIDDIIQVSWENTDPGELHKITYYKNDSIVTEYYLLQKNKIVSKLEFVPISKVKP